MLSFLLYVHVSIREAEVTSWVNVINHHNYTGAISQTLMKSYFAWPSCGYLVNKQVIFRSVYLYISNYFQWFLPYIARHNYWYFSANSGLVCMYKSLHVYTLSLESVLKINLHRFATSGPLACWLYAFKYMTMVGQTPIPHSVYHDLL